MFPIGDERVQGGPPAFVTYGRWHAEIGIMNSEFGIWNLEFALHAFLIPNS